MNCRCDGKGWLPEMCLGRWRCPCSGLPGKMLNLEAYEHAGQMCAKCDSIREAVA